MEKFRGVDYYGIEEWALSEEFAEDPLRAQVHPQAGLVPPR